MPPFHACSVLHHTTLHHCTLHATTTFHITTFHITQHPVPHHTKTPYNVSHKILQNTSTLFFNTTFRQSTLHHISLHTHFHIESLTIPRHHIHAIPPHFTSHSNKPPYAMPCHQISHHIPSKPPYSMPYHCIPHRIPCHITTFHITLHSLPHSISHCIHCHIPYHTAFVATFHSTALHTAHLPSPHSTSDHIPYHIPHHRTPHHTSSIAPHWPHFTAPHHTPIRCAYTHHIPYYTAFIATFHSTALHIAHLASPHPTIITLCIYTPNCTPHISVHIAPFRITSQHHVLHHTTCGITTSQTTGHAQYHILHHSIPHNNNAHRIKHHITRFHSTFRILSPHWTSNITQPHLIPHLCRTANNYTSHDHTTHISPLHVTQTHSISDITPPHQTSDITRSMWHDTPPVNPHHTTHTTNYHPISHQLLQSVYFISPQIIIMPHRFALPTFLQTACWRRHKKTMDHI